MTNLCRSVSRTASSLSPFILRSRPEPLASPHRSSPGCFLEIEQRREHHPGTTHPFHPQATTLDNLLVTHPVGSKKWRDQARAARDPHRVSSPKNAVGDEGGGSRIRILHSRDKERDPPHPVPCYARHLVQRKYCGSPLSESSGTRVLNLSRRSQRGT